MRKIIIRYIITVILCAFTFNADAGEFFQQFGAKIKHQTTENGLSYYHLRDKADLVYIDIAIKNAGYASDPIGKNGLSKLVSTTILTGAGEYKSYNFGYELDKIGAIVTVTSDLDILNISGVVAKSDYPRLIELLSKLLKSPHFGKAEFDVLKNRQVQLIEHELADNLIVAETVWRKAVFPDHRYANSAIGIRDDIAKLAREDLQSFAREKFTKDNLVISVLGDVDTKKLSTYFDLNLNSLPKKSKSDVELKKVIPLQKQQFILVDKDVDNSVVFFGQKGVSVKDPNYLETKILYDLFSGKFNNAFLAKELVTTNKYAYHAAGELKNYVLSSYYTGSISTTNQNAALCYQMLLELFTKMQTGIIDEAQVAWEQRYYVSNNTRDLDKNINRVKLLTELQLLDSVDMLEKLDKKIEALTADSLNKVAKRIFNVTNLTSIIVGRTSVIGRDFKK